MLERTETRFGMKPTFLAADSAYGSADSLAWFVKQKTITPHIPVFDKSNRTDDTFSESISNSTSSATVTPAPRAKNWSIPTHLRNSQKRRHSRGDTNYRASKLDSTPENSNHSAARTMSPARSRGTCTKTLATWPVRTPQLRNTWRPVVVGGKSRCCSPISSASFALPACALGDHTEPATNSPRRHCPKPEAAGPTETDERAFVGDGHIAPARTARGPTRNASYLISKPARFPPTRKLADFFNDIGAFRPYTGPSLRGPGVGRTPCRPRRAPRPAFDRGTGSRRSALARNDWLSVRKEALVSLSDAAR